MSFLGNIIREQGKFTRKPAFNTVCTHFNRFLPSTYKIGMLHMLLYGCFLIYSDWTEFHSQFFKLMDVFKSSGYFDNFISNRFKASFDNKHRIQEKVITVLKKPLFLAFPYFGSLSLQTRTKLRKSLKGVLNCW